MEHVDVGSKLQWSKIALISCYVSLALSLITLVTDLAGISIKYALWGRSGSIMVLCGVFLEFQIWSAIALWDNRTGKSFRHEDVILLDDLTTKAQSTRIKAHFFVISGTLIWGFGSLLQTAICKI